MEFRGTQNKLFLLKHSTDKCQFNGIEYTNGLHDSMQIRISEQ